MVSTGRNVTKGNVVAMLARRRQENARQNRNRKTAQIKAMHVRELARMRAAANAAAKERRYQRNAARHGSAHAGLSYGMQHGHVIGGF